MFSPFDTNPSTSKMNSDSLTLSWSREEFSHTKLKIDKGTYLQTLLFSSLPPDSTRIKEAFKHVCRLLHAVYTCECSQTCASPGWVLETPIR